MTKGKKKKGGELSSESPRGSTGREGQTYFVLVLAGQFERMWKKLKQKGTKK